MRKLFSTGFLLVVLSFLSISCTTISAKTFSYPDENQNIATIFLVRGNPDVSIMSIEDLNIPEAEKDTYWNPIEVPAGKEFTMKIHAVYSQQGENSGNLIVLLATSAIAASRSTDKIVDFVCPALDENTEYVLEYKKGAGLKGANTIILKEKQSGKIIKQEDFAS